MEDTLDPHLYMVPASLFTEGKEIDDFLVLVGLTSLSCTEATRSLWYLEDSFGGNKKTSLLTCLNWTMYSFARDAELVTVEEDKKIKSHPYMTYLSHGKAPYLCEEKKTFQCSMSGTLMM